MIVKRSVTDIVLRGNLGKMARLTVLSDEYMFVVECYARHIVGIAVHKAGHGLPPLGRYEFHPKQRTLPLLVTTLSERWKRCAWMHACGVVNSWLSNGRDRDGSDEPSFEKVCIQANVNVVLLSKAIPKGEEGTTTVYEWWLKVSTLEKGKTVQLPFDIHPYGQKVLREALASGGSLSGGVLLRLSEHGVWSVQLCVSHKCPKKVAKAKLGHDLGERKIIASSNGRVYGTLSDKLTRRVEADTQRMSLKQKLNACLKKKGLAPVSLANNATNEWVRNVAGRAIGLMVEDLLAEPQVPLSILERLSAQDMRAKSRAGNRRLKAAQISYIASHVRYRLDLAGLPWAEVNPAYTSQECRMCGFVLKQNRCTQERFACLMCGHTENADTHASKVIEVRHLDTELDDASFRVVGTILRERYMRRWTDGRPTPAYVASPSGLLVGDPGRRMTLPFLVPGGSPSSSPEPSSRCA